MSTTRTIVETGTPGWYLDPKTEKKTRKQDGDRVVSRSEWDEIVANGNEVKANREKVGGKSTVLSTGKVAKGPTMEITCKRRGCDTKRVIQVQDKFQVKFCIPHQKENRNELRKQRRQAKAKAAS